MSENPPAGRAPELREPDLPRTMKDRPKALRPGWTTGACAAAAAKAATAENAETPGTISVASPSSTQRSSCSCTAPHNDGSPEWILATRRPSATARW